MFQPVLEEQGFFKGLGRDLLPGIFTLAQIYSPTMLN